MPYLSDSLVTVRPFLRQRDRDEATIGDPARGVYLRIPVEGLDLLEALADGMTVSEAVHLYEQRHGHTPDVEDFLAALEREGFLSTVADGSDDGGHGHMRYWNLDWVPQSVAAKLFSAPVVAACLVLVAVGLFLVVDDPGLIPGPTSYLFPRDFAVLTWATLGFVLFGVAVHELAHMLAARALGVPTRLDIGHRLYILVAETDMSAIWLAPKRQRYMAFMAGIMVDAIAASLFVAVYWAARRGLLTLQSPWDLLVPAMLFSYLARLMWQTWFFMRTDLYYVISTAFDCKNLMRDTEDYLHNLVARARSSHRPVDQSHISRKEMRVVKAYSVVWILGRLVFVSMFFAFSVPIFAGYIAESIRFFSGGPSQFGSADFLTAMTITVSVTIGGAYLWARSLWRRRTERKAANALALPA